MSPLDKDIVMRKLGVIIDNIRALARVSGMTVTQYREDVFVKKATERLLQELIEAAIDINTHIAVQTGQNIPDDYFGSFLKAAEGGVISSSLAEKLAPSAGLRNRLVHEYDFIDDRLVLEAVEMVNELYPEYVKSVEGFVSSID